MSKNIISKWNEQFEEKISESSLRKKYPPDKYRVSVFSYPEGTKFTGSMHEGACFALEGQCIYSFNGNKISLSANEFKNLPQGNYTLEVIGKNELKIALVWDISNLK